MKTKFKTRFLVAFLMLLLASSILAQNTAFTYQGQLASGGSPANGAFDLQLTLFGSQSGGVAVAGPLTFASTPIANGLFSVQPDFGAAVFTGSPLWLQIAVRPGGSTASYTPLTPLQLISVTPYAITAYNANNLLGMLPASQLSGPIPASQISGALNSAQLPSSLLVNNQSGVTLDGVFSGTFAGNGFDLTNLGAANLSGAIPSSLLPSLLGDVTGGITLNSVASVGGQTAANIASAASLANNGTSLNTPSTLVKRDASGNFIGGTITAATNFVGNGGGLTNIKTANVVGQFSGVQLPPLTGDVTGTLSSTSVATVGGQTAANVGTGVALANSSASANIANAIVRRNGAGSFSASTMTASNFVGSGTGLTGLNAATVTVGTLPTSALPASVAQVNLSQIFTQPQIFTNGFSVHTGVGSVTIEDDQGLAPAIVAGAGPNSGDLRMRNYLQIFPNEAGTTPGSLDVRDINGNASILLSGASGTITATNVSATTLSGSLNASQLTGTLAAAQLPSTVVASGSSPSLGGLSISGSSGNFGNGLEPGTEPPAVATMENTYKGGNVFGIGLFTAPVLSLVSDGDSNPWGVLSVTVNNGGGGNLGAFNGLQGNYVTIDEFGTVAGSGAALFQTAGIQDSVSVGSSASSPAIYLSGSDGNITNTGTVYSHGVALTSDRNAKEHFTAVDSRTILDGVLSLDVAEWNYKGDPADKKHIGPVAQDFHAAFGLDGADDKHISVIDEGGVALAAIQGLQQEIKNRDDRIAALEKAVAALKQLIQASSKAQSASGTVQP